MLALALGLLITVVDAPTAQTPAQVLVPAPSARREDDAVLLTVGAAAEGDRSVLVVLDAATLEPLAHAEVPLPIPLGFHGSFFPAAGASAPTA